jgi:ABC-type sugar transport system substrate-binding protein
VYKTSELKREPRVYEISVISSGSEDDYWNEIFSGIEQAASDLRVELNSIQAQDAQAQISALAVETDTQVDGILIKPANNSAVLDNAVRQAAKNTYVVEISPQTTEAEADKLIQVTTSDAAETDALCARISSVAAQMSDPPVICPIAMSPDAPWAAERYPLLKAKLAVMGLSVQNLTLIDEPNLMGLNNSHTICVAMDDNTLKNAAAGLADLGKQTYLCGFGGTGAVIHYIETGIIDCCVADNAYILGYEALWTAVDALNGQRTAPAPIALVLVDAQNLYKPDTERLLFPISK